MENRKLAVGLVFILAMTCASCGAQSPRGSMNVRLEIAPDPPKVGPAAVILELREGNDQPVLGATIELEATMTHPGMKPEFARAQEVGGGRYRAELTFTMAGDWVLIVRGTRADGTPFEQHLKIPNVRPK